MLTSMVFLSVCKMHPFLLYLTNFLFIVLRWSFKMISAAFSSGRQLLPVPLPSSISGLDSIPRASITQYVHLWTPISLHNMRLHVPAYLQSPRRSASVCWRMSLSRQPKCPPAGEQMHGMEHPYSGVPFSNQKDETSETKRLNTHYTIHLHEIM